VDVLGLGHFVSGTFCELHLVAGAFSAETFGGDTFGDEFILGGCEK
jgi:hypothetical protein